MTDRKDGRIIAGPDELTQAELHQRALKVAAGLRAEGLAEGESIALLMRNDLAFVELMMGAAHAGVYVAPINWHATAEEIAHILADSGARMVFAHADLAPALPSEGPKIISVDLPEAVRAAYRIEAPPPSGHWARWRDSHAAAQFAPAPPRANIIYTSGTTGHPKGIEREPATGAMAARVREVVAYGYGLRPDQEIRTAITGPMYHSVPNVYAQHAVRTPGSLVLIPARFDAAELLRLIDAHRLTHLHLVPTMMVRLLALPETVRAQYDVSSLQHVVHGAAPCPPQIRAQMIDWFGPVIGEYYGASETGPGVVLRPEEAPAHPGSVGRPTPWTSLEIIDETGQPCPPGTPGEIFMKIADYPRFEYRNQPGKADQMRRGDLVSAGDIGWLDEAGYLFLCDRKSDMIISGGVNIYPAEIEAALMQIDGVRDAVVFGVPDAEYGERVVAMVDADLPEEALRRGLGDGLAKYKHPRAYRITPDLNREDSGKLRKRKLRESWIEAQEILSD